MHLGRLYLLVRALPKTLIFNLHYFGLRGLRLPVIVSHRVKICGFRGTVTVPHRAPLGAIRIGFGNVSIFDQDRTRTLWDNRGRVVFFGSASLRHGTRISVAPTGRVIFGDKFIMTAEYAIVSSHEIRFGTDCYISWQVLIMDTDFHPLRDRDGNRTNPDAPVVLGEHIWIGCRSLILKGAHIPAGSVIAAGSIVSGNFEGCELLIAGN